MPSENNTPAIRFAGFTGEWERRKLGEICDEFKSGDFIPASEISKLGTYPVFGGNGLRGFTQRHNHSGEYAIIGRQGALCGNVNYSTGQAYFTEHAIAVRANRNNETRFIFYLLKLLNLGQYSAQSAQPGLAVNKIIALQALLPSKAEQTKVAAILSILDTLITLRRRKCELLETLKKSMLEKLFPKEGELVPELRFAGFTGEWERRKLGEIAEIEGGGTPSTIIPEYWDGQIDWYTPAEMEGLRYATESARKITELGLYHSSAKVLPADRTVLFTSRAGIGKMAILKSPAATNQGFQSLILKDGYSCYFIYSMNRTIKAKAESIASGSTFLEISGKALGCLEVSVPSEEEQHHIAKFFESLDDIITLHRRKLEHLQNIKKACLEKMFV